MAGLPQRLRPEKVFSHVGGSPQFNLAFEEAMLEYSMSSDIILGRIWINPKSVVIGYNLEPCEEVRCNEAERLGVPIVRRVSGGGAVYHDYGNINVTLVVPGRLSVDEGYKIITGIIMDALRLLGVKAHIENINDVVVGRWKVSGSSLAVKARATLAHATLLVDSDIALLRRLLIPRWDRVERGEVTPAKYNPANLSSIDPSITMNRALKALATVLSAGEAEFAYDAGGVIDRAHRLCIDKYIAPKWSPPKGSRRESCNEKPRHLAPLG